MEQVTVRVPAKVIILGEHSVLRGQPGLVASLPGFHTTCVARKSVRDDFDAAIGEVVGRLDIPPEEHVFVRVESTIPRGAGLGSSAAFVVAIAKAVYSLLEIEYSSKGLFEKCRDIEGELFHGASSGIDVAAVVEGANREDGVVLRFQYDPASKLANWKRVSIPPGRYRMLLKDSGTRRSTKDLTRQSWDAAELALLGSLVDGVLDGEIDLKAAFNTTMDIFMAKPGLVPESLRGLREAKMTGAGGGGFYLQLAETSLPSTNTLHICSVDSP